MELSIAALEELGAFAPARPEKREIEWTSDSKTHKAIVYVRKLSFATLSTETMTPNFRDNVMAARIAASIVDKDNKPIFSAADLVGNETRGPICQSLGMALLAAVAEVNNLAGEIKNSPPPNPSGTSSFSQESVAEQ
ncbi:phage tail assembly chaperone family protein, TAC [Alishewanella sp. d11]|uniref:phage tail assembly chaperone family protein, TAC n=1 Tax=Alishewanella sp. d11 TaxID=3414030 RepID=UPI003BF84221